MHFPTIAVFATTTALFVGQGLAASWRTYPASDPIEACRGQKLLTRCWYTVTYTAAPRREPKEKLAGTCKDQTKVDNRKRTTCVPDIPGRRPIYDGAKFTADGKIRDNGHGRKKTPGRSRETGRNGKKPLIPIWERPEDEERAEREHGRGEGEGGKGKGEGIRFRARRLLERGEREVISRL